jgi:hypothetical protein
MAYIVFDKVQTLEYTLYMRGRFNDLTGKVFGRLLVLSQAPRIRGRIAFKCSCTCGNTIVVTSKSLLSGNTRSCGCLFKEQLSKRATKHGERWSRLYSIWLGMRSRCNSKTHASYRLYGGRGIKVCSEWDDFSTFRQWALANGYEPNLTIDRIDVNGNYCPENCRWADWETQCYNKTNTRFLTYKGETKPLRIWAKQFGIKPSTLRGRLDIMGWSVDKALETAVQVHR